MWLWHSSMDKTPIQNRKKIAEDPAVPRVNEPPYDKTNKMACAPNEDSDQPEHPPSLIRVFAVCMKKAWVLSYPLSAQRRHWTDWADTQTDLSLCWAHSHFVGFVMRRLKCLSHVTVFFFFFFCFFSMLGVPTIPTHPAQPKCLCCIW